MTCILPSPKKSGNKGHQGKTDGNVKMSHAEHKIGNNNGSQSPVFAYQEVLKRRLKASPGDKFLHRGKHGIGKTSEDEAAFTQF